MNSYREITGTRKIWRGFECVLRPYMAICWPRPSPKIADRCFPCNDYKANDNSWCEQIVHLIILIDFHIRLAIAWQTNPDG